MAQYVKPLFVVNVTAATTVGRPKSATHTAGPCPMHVASQHLLQWYAFFMRQFGPSVLCSLLASVRSKPPRRPCYPQHVGGDDLNAIHPLTRSTRRAPLQALMRGLSSGRWVRGNYSSPEPTTWKAHTFEGRHSAFSSVSHLHYGYPSPNWNHASLK